MPPDGGWGVFGAGAGGAVGAGGTGTKGRGVVAPRWVRVRSRVLAEPVAGVLGAMPGLPPTIAPPGSAGPTAGPPVAGPPSLPLRPGPVRSPGSPRRTVSLPRRPGRWSGQPWNAMIGPTSATMSRGMATVQPTRLRAPRALSLRLMQVLSPLSAETCIADVRYLSIRAMK